MSDSDIPREASSADSIRAMEGMMNGVRSIVRALRMNTREIEAKIGMSLAQLFVLQTLAERPASSLNEIAARTATHQSSVSVVVRRLVEKGYVSRTRSNLDQRRVDLAVTMNGRAILSGAPVMVQTRLLGELQRMPANELLVFSSQFQRWLEGAGIDQSPAPMFGENETTTEGAA
jgi:DNA-binding MarR family transcriptional regulator